MSNSQLRKNPSPTLDTSVNNMVWRKLIELNSWKFFAEEIPASGRIFVPTCGAVQGCSGVRAVGAPVTGGRGAQG